MPHIDPLDRSELPQFEEKFARYDAIRGFLPNSILTMGRRPNIAAAFMELNQAILYEGTVPEALKMMVALMTSMATGCRYCQGHMANLSHVYDVPEYLIKTHKLPHLQTFIHVFSRTEAGGKTNHTEPVYLLSKMPTAQVAATLIRGHREIENNLHWSLDMVMNDDQNRAGERYAPGNFVTLHCIALGFIKADKDNGTNRGKFTRKQGLAMISYESSLKTSQAQLPRSHITLADDILQQAPGSLKLNS